MSFFEFPHTRTYDSDLGWLIVSMKKLISEMDEFVDFNKIKFADPITWSIDRNYEATTVVVDDNGSGYISQKPVPAGVPLSDTNYWTQIFAFGELLDILREQITAANEKTKSTASAPRSTGDLVFLNGLLYVVTEDMPIGTKYIEGSNIEKITIEELLKNDITGIKELIQNEATARKNEDEILLNAINTEASARENEDKILLNSINAEASARENAINAEASARENADNALSDRIDNIRPYAHSDIRNYGGVGDGVTDDTEAFNACMSANGLVYIPIGDPDTPLVFKLSEITLNGNNNIIADFGASVKYEGTGNLFTIKGGNVKIVGLTANFTNQGSFISIENTTGAHIKEFIFNNIITIGALHFISDVNSTSGYVSTYIDTIECKVQKGRCMDIHHSFAFLLCKDITSDATGLPASANFTHFWFENSQGMQLYHLEAEGGLIDAYNVANSGFYFKNCTATWLDKCLADTCAGAGFYQDTGCEYFYISNCAASLCCGFGFLLNGSNHQLTGCYVVGRRGLTPIQTGANGINSYSNNTNIDNCTILNCEGVGVAIQSGRHLIGNVSVHGCAGGIGDASGSSGYVHDCDVSGNDTQIAAVSLLYRDIFNGTSLWGNVPYA